MSRYRVLAGKMNKYRLQVIGKIDNELDQAYIKQAYIEHHCLNSIYLRNVKKVEELQPEQEKRNNAGVNKSLSVCYNYLYAIILIK